jgi:hypothetical protein
MIRIAITQAAYDAIVATLPLGAVALRLQCNRCGFRQDVTAIGSR